MQRLRSLQMSDTVADLLQACRLDELCWLCRRSADVKTAAALRVLMLYKKELHNTGVLMEGP